MKENNYAICVEGLKKIYLSDNKEKKIVYNNLDIKFEKGKVHCLLGESGSGKSTLLKIIAGLESFEDGKISYYDEYYNDGKNALTMILQENNLLPWLTVSQNIKFSLNSLKLKVNDFDKELEKYDLIKIKDCFPHELSVGLRQKVVFARAIMLKPKIIFLDEPFSALDFLSREKGYMIFLESLNKNRFTSIFSTHSIEEAVKLADYIHLIKENKCEKIKNPIKKPVKENYEFYNFIKYIKERYRGCI